MKKILSLVAMALVAISVNAKEEVPQFTPWEGNDITVEGTTFSLPGGWKGAATNFDFGENDDKTAFDYVYMKYSGATGTPSFGIVYNEWESTQSWGESFATITVAVPDGEGIVAIKLDKETAMKYGNAKEDGQGIGDVYAKHVSGVQIQSGNSPATLTIEGVWFGTRDEYVADGGDLPTRPAVNGELTIWEGTQAFDSWSVKMDFDVKYFDVAEVGDIVRCYISDPASPNPVFKYGGTWTDFTELQSTKKITDTYIEATITNADALASLKKSGLSMQGQGFTLNKVVLLVPEPAKEYQTTGKELTVAENGEILATEFAGYSDDAKVVFVTTVTGSTGYVGWGNGSITSIGGAVNLGMYNITGEGDNEVAFLLKELKEALDAPGFYYEESDTNKENPIPTASGLSWGCWGFDDGACTSTRKSCTIYEVDGFSGEGYQPTGISEIVTARKQDNLRYNMAGQKVGRNYKGVVIMGGKKMVLR